jgi:CBS domain containing-hemolysin-like protein
VGDIPSWEIPAIHISLLASFFCSGTETALTSLTEARTRQILEESGDPKHPLRLWLDHPERLLTTLLFGNTLTNIALSALVTSMATRLGVPYAVGAATGVTTFVVLTFCEVTPKTLAKRHAERFAKAAVPIVAFFYWVFLPATWLLLFLTNGMMRLLGEKKVERPAVTGAEIEYMIGLGSREGVLDDVKKQLLTSVLEFADILVKESMVPRTRMVGLEKSASFEQVLAVISESEHSRIPVFEESIDNVVGVLYVKDLARDLQRGLTAEGFKLEKYLRPPFFVPELMKISRLLREFQKRKVHIAVVVDEFGGTAGLVTLEDVVEEIVGEIQDEYDMEEKQVKALPDGRFLAEGNASLRDVEAALDVEFPEDGAYETLGGFLTAVSGRVPTTGSLVVWEGLAFTIRAADERHVTKVEIGKMKESSPSGQGSGEKKTG